MDKFLAYLLKGHLAPFALALPIYLLLITLPDWHWWAGIPTPDYSLDPNPISLGIYLYLFLLGWVLDRQRPLLNVIKERWIENLVIGLTATTLCLTVTGWRSAALQDIASNPDVYVYAAAYSIAIMALTQSFIGCGMAFFNKQSPIMRYLADASYWIYIWHLPVVFGMSTLLMDVNLHWIVKYPSILALTLLPFIVSYDLFVRSTIIGKSLNGKKQPRTLFATRIPQPALESVQIKQEIKYGTIKR
jgi:glucan biosynthesis protein C